MQRLRSLFFVRATETQTWAEDAPDFTNLLVTSKSNHSNWGVFHREPMELMDRNVSRS